MNLLTNFGEEKNIRAISSEKHNEIINWLGSDLYRDLYKHFYLGTFINENERLYVYVDFLVDSFDWDKDKFMLLLLKVLDSKQHNIIEAYRQCESSEEFFDFLYSEKLLTLVSESVDDLTTYFRTWMLSRQLMKQEEPNYYLDSYYPIFSPFKYSNTVFSNYTDLVKEIHQNVFRISKIPVEWTSGKSWYDINQLNKF